MAPFIYMMMKYVTLYVSRFGKVSEIYMRITVSLAGLHLLGCILTPFTGLYYVVSDENIYYRDKGVVLAGILPIAVYIMVTILALQFRKQMRTRAVVSLLSYMWIPGVGQLVQNLFAGNQPFKEGTPEGDAFLGVLNRFKFIFKKINLKDIDGNPADMFEILKHSAGNYGIDDHNAILKLK